MVLCEMVLVLLTEVTVAVSLVLVTVGGPPQKAAAFSGKWHQSPCWQVTPPQLHGKAPGPGAASFVQASKGRSGSSVCTFSAKMSRSLLSALHTSIMQSFSMASASFSLSDGVKLGSSSRGGYCALPRPAVLWQSCIASGSPKLTSPLRSHAWAAGSPAPGFSGILHAQILTPTVLLHSTASTALGSSSAQLLLPNNCPAAAMTQREPLLWQKASQLI